MQVNSQNLIKGRDIVIVGQQPWDTEIGSNCKNIAAEMSKYNRVLYVNSPLDRITKFKLKADSKVQRRIRVMNGDEDGLILLQDNLWNLYPDSIIESINWIKSQYIFEILNKLNNRSFALSIMKAIRKLGFRDVILFNDNDIFRSFYLKDYLKPSVSVYYSRDYMLAVDYWKKHGEKMEYKLIMKSDVCVANSTYLANYCGRYNPNSYYVGQGCELDIFAKAGETNTPTDLKELKYPIIGYVGALQSLRLSIETIEYIAKSHPDWSVVLVGPEDDDFKKSVLHSIDNIYFLGSREPSHLPAYINAFDVCINPQIVSQVTVGNYPRKIDEYLAVGKPVVATETEAMQIFKEHTYLAATKEDYVTLIETALQDDSPALKDGRRLFASSHTWENSVAEIYKAINTKL